ncbi:MAG: leucine-rich repeat domain-containing protein [bacterium]
MFDAIRHRHVGHRAAIALAILILLGCSQTGNNDVNAPAMSLRMEITSPELMKLVTQFELVVTGPGMDSIFAELTLEGRYLVGEVDVPVGRDRKFEIFARDANGREIYRGVIVKDVSPGDQVELIVNLYPVVPLIKLSPRFVQVPSDSSGSLDVRVYRLDSLFNISFKVYSSSYLVHLDSAVLGPDVDPNDFLLDQTSGDTGSYSITPLEVHRLPIVDDSGYATLASIYYSTFYPEMGSDTAVLTIEPTLMYKTNDDSIPVASVVADESLIQIIPNTENPVIVFPDAQLDYVVRQALEPPKPEGALFLSDVLTISALYAGVISAEPAISDLTGLHYLTNLVHLTLTDNDIRDISELSTLVNLEMLFLGNNDSIQDITALSGLTKLQQLGLQSNNIVDVRPLALNSGLDSSDIVFLENNPLQDITQLVPLCIRQVVVYLQPEINYCSTIGREPGP